MTKIKIIKRPEYWKYYRPKLTSNLGVFIMAKTYSSFDNRNIKALISQYKLYKDIPCEDIKNIMKDSVAKLNV
ncbi:hypothetical protein JZM13_25635, partial [Escherichia coli]|nr:hypothetical protein [Escherichia coli]